MSGGDLFGHKAPERSCIFSECRQWRYVLTVSWDETKPPLVFFMLNPSTADEHANDATVERCQIRAERLGYGSITILNLFAWRATEPEDMKAQPDPVGPDNDRWIKSVLSVTAEDGGDVICAWGTHGSHNGRDVEAIPFIFEAGLRPKVLKLTKHGYPSHPLYLSYELQPKPWDALA